MKPRLIVHGGAWNIPRPQHQVHIKGCHDAVQTVLPHLTNGLSALETVEKAVAILEEDPTFDAGRGAFLNAEGDIELDAIICDGRNLNFGAVAAVKNILHPVSAARLLMNYPEHCFMVGEGAQKFLRKLKFPEVNIEDLLTDRELEYYQQIKADLRFRTRQPFENDLNGTVGAVAMDLKGNLAAATSTGGTPRKMPGRVGDSPVIGAGAYADNDKGAASATGFGESILKVLLCKMVCDSFQTLSPMDAAQNSISYLKNKVDGLGGIIGINPEGDYALAYNTPFMAFAYAESTRKIISGISCP